MYLDMAATYLGAATYVCPAATFFGPAATNKAKLVGANVFCFECFESLWYTVLAFFVRWESQFVLQRNLEPGVEQPFCF